MKSCISTQKLFSNTAKKYLPQSYYIALRVKLGKWDVSLP